MARLFLYTGWNPPKLYDAREDVRSSEPTAVRPLLFLELFFQQHLFEERSAQVSAHREKSHALSLLVRLVLGKL